MFMLDRKTQFSTLPCGKQRHSGPEHLQPTVFVRTPLVTAIHIMSGVSQYTGALKPLIPFFLIINIITK